MTLAEGFVTSEIGIYVGDPIYILRDSDFSNISRIEGSARIESEQGPVNVFCFPSSNNKTMIQGANQKMPIDSGLLALIPMELIPEDNRSSELGEFFELRQLQVEVEKYVDSLKFEIKGSGLEYIIYA